MHDILDVIKNIDTLYENNTSLSVLKDMERVFDQLDLYAYANWLDGELAYGPQVDRHWITAGFMWPYNYMPDPDGALRLTGAECKVTYERSHLIEPRKIKTPDDYRPGTKKGKLDRTPIWIVEIQMPKKIAFNVYRGYIDKLKTETMGSPGHAGTPIPGAAAPITPIVGGMPPAGSAPAAGGMPPAGSAPAGGSL